jgi:hypothetical protein
MGLFDTVKCSYDLGPGYINRELQTKDLDCCMADYWISPAGQLYEIDYGGTHTFETIKENDPRYDSNKKFLNFEWIPTGQRGKIKPVYIFKIVELYPAKWDGHYSKWPSCHVLFRDGIITEVRHTPLHEFEGKESTPQET